MKNIKITTRHLDITDKIKKQLTEKLSVLDRYSANIKNIQMILDHVKGQFIVEARVAVKQGKTITSKVADYNYIAAINNVADKIENQLGRIKDKITKPYQKPASKSLKDNGLEQEDWY
jgi:ribosome-associated inhibitor A